MVAMPETPAVKNQNIADSSIADRINTTFNDLERNGRITVEKAFELGKLLLEAKVQQQHGDRLIWLETNCPRLVRQAPIFINLYRHRAKLKVTAGSSPFGLFRLLGSIDPDAPPEIGKNTNSVFLRTPGGAGTNTPPQARGVRVEVTTTNYEVRVPVYVRDPPKQIAANAAPDDENDNESNCAESDTAANGAPVDAIADVSPLPPPLHVSTFEKAIEMLRSVITKPIDAFAAVTASSNTIEQIASFLHDVLEHRRQGTGVLHQHEQPGSET
jgi:hypothetical protein